MWDVSITKRHTSDPQSLRPGIDKLLSKVKKEHGIKGKWSGSDLFVVESGGHVNEGELKISSSAVTVNLKLDFLGRLAKGKVREAIEKELDRIV